jgi:hypothetical protein
MSRPRATRQCKHGRTCFAPDPPSAKRQRYCSQPACRQASTAASPYRWFQQPGHRDYCTGPAHVERLRQGRRAPAGSWRRPGTWAPRHYTRAERHKSRTNNHLMLDCRRRRYKRSAAGIPLWSWALSRIAPAGRDTRTAPPPPAACNNWAAIWCMGQPLTPEASRRAKRLLSLAPLRPGPRQCSGGDQRLVRERYIDQLRHEACPLARFLVTGVDAPGLRDYADPSLCQRLSLSGPELHQARQALLTRGCVASHRPRSPV